MKKLLRKTFERFSAGRWVLILYRRFKFSIWYPFFAGSEALFESYYQNQVWGSDESGSGRGSTLTFTQGIRKELPGLFKELQIRHLLDAPCGDFNWFAEIRDELNLTYTGADIVQSVVRLNQNRFSDDQTQFLHLDITEDALPNADLWLLRDCLIHLSDKDIKRALRIFLHADIQWLLTTSYTESEENSDIATGEHRFLNVCIAPFHFPEPERWLIDHPQDGNSPVKKLGLWRKDQLIHVINRYA